MIQNVGSFTFCQSIHTFKSILLIMDNVLDVINECKPEAHGMKLIVKFVMECITLMNCIFSCCFVYVWQRSRNRKHMHPSINTTKNTQTYYLGVEWRFYLEGKNRCKEDVPVVWYFWRDKIFLSLIVRWTMPEEPCDMTITLDLMAMFDLWNQLTTIQLTCFLAIKMVKNAENSYPKDSIVENDMLGICSGYLKTYLYLLT